MQVVEIQTGLVQLLEKPFTFGHFAITETRSNWDLGHLAGMPQKRVLKKDFLNL